MKRLTMLMFLLLPLVLYGEDFPFQGVVRKVIDGDTIELKSGELVRYIGIDAPETEYSRKKQPQAFGKEATEANRRLVEGKTVRLEYDKQVKDDHNRLLAYVYVGETFVNGELVRKGFALYSPFSPNKSKNILLLQYENEARKNKLGIWALPLRNPSKEYLAKAEKEGAIKKFHLSECPHAKRIDARNKVVFSSIDEALDNGYRPCRICNPLERHNH